jgi:hypothetical protein
MSGVPTSVLLAVLAAAGLLALAPALVRRYDATERRVAEREWSTARVLSRQRRRRTVPRLPVNPPRVMTAASTVRPGAVPASTAAPGSTAGALSHATTSSHAASSRIAASTRGAGSARGAGSRRGGTASRQPGRRIARPARRRRPLLRRLRRSPLVRLLLARPVLSRPSVELTDGQRRRWWRYRRRRVLLALSLLLTSELVGVATIGPGFWFGVAAATVLVVAYLAHLRGRALADQRRRREQARRLAAAEARARRARAAARRRAAEIAARREALERQLAAAREAEAARLADEDLADGTFGTPGLRGRPYEARAVNF